MGRETVGAVFLKARCLAVAAVRRASLVHRSDSRTGRAHPRDAGMSTAEYAVGTIAACGFAAALYKVVTSGAVTSELQQLLERALSAKF